MHNTAVTVEHFSTWGEGVGEGVIDTNLKWERLGDFLQSKAFLMPPLASPFLHRPCTTSACIYLQGNSRGENHSILWMIIINLIKFHKILLMYKDLFYSYCFRDLAKSEHYFSCYERLVPAYQHPCRLCPDEKAETNGVCWPDTLFFIRRYFITISRLKSAKLWETDFKNKPQAENLKRMQFCVLKVYIYNYMFLTYSFQIS